MAGRVGFELRGATWSIDRFQPARRCVRTGENPGHQPSLMVKCEGCFAVARKGAKADGIPRIQPCVSYGEASQAKAVRCCSAPASVHRPRQALQIFHTRIFRHVADCD